MNIIENRCPHAIRVSDGRGAQRVIARTYPAVRIETTPGPLLGYSDGIPLHAPPGWKGIVHLPEKRCGVLIVVSQIVALAVAALLPERTDVVYPGTGPKDGVNRSADRGVMSVCRLIRAV
jgi:hypothetical protein